MPTMATAQRVRDVMTRGVDCASIHDTLTDVARRMRAMNVRAMPVVSDDERLFGMISDRDIVISCIASGRDGSSTQVREIIARPVVTVPAEANVHAAIRAMAEHGVRRLPVVEGAGRLVGIVAQHDLPRHLPPNGLRRLLKVLARD